MDITVSITTKNRYYNTLPMSLISVINQTLSPKEIILVDDNDQKDFYNMDMYKNLIKLMKLKGIKFSYYHGPSKGQVYAQQVALEHCTTDWLFKMDDDNILDNNVLEVLSSTVTENTGAVSGLIFGCDLDINRPADEEPPMFNRIEHIFSHFNIQMCGGQEKSIKQCEHLYSNYLFNTKIVDSYALEFSPAGHREDTVFTYNIFRKGYDLFVNPNCITYHINNKVGGNNVHGFNNVVKNEELFIKYLTEWNIVPGKITIIREKNQITVDLNGKKYFIYST